MNNDELKEICKPIIHDLQGGILSQQSVINRNFKQLFELRELNIPIDKIIEICGFTYSNSTFRNKFYECKLKYKNVSTHSASLNFHSNIPTKPNKDAFQKEKSVSNIAKDEPKNNSEIDIDAWRETFARNIHEKIPDNLIEKLARGLTEINVNLNNWHLFAKKHSIFNAKKLLYIFSNRRMYKFEEE